ncbi:MAG: Rne/Rng family ribonuclease [Deltaproteobacteria bacterium]|nr:MAG: Rne/Rng family ribonuclease [Deltaproteobacteria bacterium]
MNNLLVINVAQGERRVALVEKGVLSGLFIERPSDRSVVGNIYLGRVSRVLAGMDAAFVDIGLDKAGFLYVSDVIRPIDYAQLGLPEEYGSEDEIDETHPAKPTPDITKLLANGETIMVQVSKAPIGTKGARLTTHITLPGRLLVYLPTVEHIGVSRRIELESERRRLREIVERLRPESGGFIIRTAAEGADEASIRADMEFLTKLWMEVRQKAKGASAPVRLYRDLDLVKRVTRDLFTADIDKLIVDDAEQHRQLLEFVRTFMPALAGRVELYTGTEPLFDALGLEVEVTRALERKVWLRSGGYIVIDQAEALCAIDVNTGKYVGKHNLEDTITKINLEAVKEIVYQLKVRDIGGIIIIDFIDMEKESNRDKVYSALQAELANDRAKTNILKISELGLVEMTRKRVRENLMRFLTETCPYCEGSGRVKTTATVGFEILRAIERECAGRRGRVFVKACADVVDWLLGDEQELIDEIEKRLGIGIVLDVDEALHREQFDVVFEPENGGG